MKQITQIKMDALQAALQRISYDLDAINIYMISGDGWRDNTPLAWGINWGAMGTVSAEETKTFADNLLKATAICEALNSLELLNQTISNVRDYTTEEYHKEVDLIKRLLELGDADFIGLWLDK